MSYFLNYKTGVVKIESSHNVSAVATDVADIIDAYEQGREAMLTASIDSWVKEELAKISLGGLSRDEAENIVFGESDFMESIEKLGISLGDYPELRELQHDYINNAQE